MSRVYGDRDPDFARQLAFWLICAGLWFALTPLILALARRFPLGRSRWLLSISVHIGVSVVLSVLLLGLYVLITHVIKIASDPSLISSFRGEFVASIHFEMLTYWMVIGLFHGVDYYSKYREREFQASQLETRLAQAQLNALKMQLHPHFLFNTLNSVSILMTEDVAAARRILSRLSELLRTSLDNLGRHEVSLREELEFLKAYLEIEETRFQDRLTVQLQIDSDLLDEPVPNLILQPLVENAIRHGIASRAQKGVIEINAARDNGMMRLTVRDDGPGLGKKSPDSVILGIGLSNTRDRLKQLYGGNHRFEMMNANGGGLEIVIVIPRRNGTNSSEGN